jgi:hypothetical protein
VTVPTSSIRASLFVLLLTGAASAQAPAKADALFREGQRLFAQKRYDEACPKLAFSARMAPSSAAEIALGFCYEAQGKTASAWAAYNAVIPLTKTDGRADRARVAAGRVKALNPRLARMTITTDKANATIDGFELREDGVLLDQSAWADRPVDPGEHDIEVQAPGYVTYSTKYTIGTSPQQETLDIPKLAPASQIATPAPVAVAATPAPSAPIVIPWRTVGIATGAVGVATVVVGSVLGGLALSKVDAAHKACPSSPCGNTAAISENAAGGGLANASTGTFVVGGALIATGALLYVLLPPKQTAPPADEPHAEPVVSLGFVGFRGTF